MNEGGIKHRRKSQFLRFLGVEAIGRGIGKIFSIKRIQFLQVDSWSSRSLWKELWQSWIFIPKRQCWKSKIYKNEFLISRITSKTLSDKDTKSTIDFFNNPDNFDWGETTWDLNESEYILRFFDNQDNEIGKVWLCVEACGMTESIPFSPNMKFGGLSEDGRKQLDSILKRISEN